MEHTPQQRARPESIAARNFSDDLDSLFGLNSGTTLGNLSFTVEEKKRTVSTREEELAAIEARLRETEQRLARAAHSPDHESTSEQAAPGAQPSYASRDAAPRQMPGYQSYPEQQYQARPPNNREESFRPHIPGAMPQTPTPQYGHGQDYVTVDRTR
ncbi:hypothetical protein E4T50_04911 [Aureobasidium sp. EXF-12298]|nr:hypothetical protein E4T50_04911 [Aureobasidium sp. EXF-12298]